METETAITVNGHQDAAGVSRRSVTDEQLRRFEGYAAEIFDAFGMEMDTPGNRATRRAASSRRCTTPRPATTAIRSC